MRIVTKVGNKCIEILLVVTVHNAHLQKSLRRTVILFKTSPCIKKSTNCPNLHNKWLARINLPNTRHDDARDT